MTQWARLIMRFMAGKPLNDWLLELGAPFEARVSQPLLANEERIVVPAGDLTFRCDSILKDLGLQLHHPTNRTTWGLGSGQTRNFIASCSAATT